MISELAVGDIEDMESNGLHPTPRDVIRLNAFALAIEAARGKRPTEDIFLLPRVSVLNDKMSIRQPTIAHEIWIDNIMRQCSHDRETRLAIKCYALSRPPEELPPSESISSVRVAIDSFCEAMSAFTRDQLEAAVNYAVYGFDQTNGERAAKNASVPDEDPSEGTADWDECIAQGLLYRGVAMLSGMSVADLSKMRVGQLQETIRRAARFNRVELNDGIDYATARYYAVLNEITERLRKEKEDAKDGI